MGWMDGWVGRWKRRREEEVWDHLVFPSLWLPLGCFPGSCHRQPRGDKGPGSCPARLWASASRRTR